MCQCFYSLIYIVPFTQVVITLNNMQGDFDIPVVFYRKNSMDISFKGMDAIMEDTTIDELFDLFNSADMVITQIGWTLAMAEILNKKLFVFFSGRGLKSKDYFFRTITPRKVITKRTSSYCIDDWSSKKIQRRFEKLKCSK